MVGMVPMAALMGVTPQMPGATDGELSAAVGEHLLIAVVDGLVNDAKVIGVTPNRNVNVELKIRVDSLQPIHDAVDAIEELATDIFKGMPVAFYHLRHDPPSGD